MLRISGLYTLLTTGARAIFQAPNPPTVPFGTQVTAAWLNDVQENICAVIEGGGLLLSDGDALLGQDQLYNAIKQMAGASYALVQASATLTAANAGRLVVDCSAGNVVLTLPPASSMNGVYAGGAISSNSIVFEIFRRDNTANTLTIVAPTGNGIGFAGLSAGSYVLPPLTNINIFSDATDTWVLTVQSPAPAPPQWQEWTAHGTYNFVVPAGKTSTRWTLIGAGGGGGGVKQAGDAAAGGAGAERAVFTIPVTPGELLTVLVGQGCGGGLGGASPAAGNNATVTSVSLGGALLAQVTGGTGGPASAGAGIVGFTGTVGTASAGSGVTMAGVVPATAGGPGLLISSGFILNGQGGAPNGAALAQVYSVGPAPVVAAGFGGWGGTYIGAPGNGATGADGYVRVEW